MPERRRPLFGRIDPYCWCAVLPLVLVAILIAVSGGLVIGMLFLVLAGLVLLFDSWVNRPDPDERRPRPAGPARAPQAAPPRQARPPRPPAGRGPVAGPGPGAGRPVRRPR
ncbi:hypothetical protein ACFWY9_29165 [Amycolatopsis sp. NPDC059027]|uniref:hypothetical protein n=1 Tax=unclassified Amycolatopsis TaxID=2618356 RepID=UPI00366FBFFD